MRVEYSGLRAALSERDRVKLERKLVKIQRILTKRGELESHIRLSRQRHLSGAEVTLRAKRHTLVVTQTGPTPFAAALSALGKLEKQARRHKRKIIVMHRPGRQRDRPSVVVEDSIRRTVPAPRPPPAPRRRSPRIVPSRRIEPKPMTADEALLLLEERRHDLVTFRDASSGRVNVLVRRRDGDAELVQGD